MLSKSLIASLMLSNFACAHAKAEHSEEFTGYVKMEQGIIPIDPENPPRDGVWMSWQDAIAMATNKRHERQEFMIVNEQIKLERDLAQMRLEKTSKALSEAESPMAKFWKTWGFPIGILLGFGVGFGTFLLVR